MVAYRSKADKRCPCWLAHQSVRHDTANVSSELLAKLCKLHYLRTAGIDGQNSILGLGRCGWLRPEGDVHSSCSMAGRQGGERAFSAPASEMFRSGKADDHSQTLNSHFRMPAIASAAVSDDRTYVSRPAWSPCAIRLFSIYMISNRGTFGGNLIFLMPGTSGAAKRSCSPFSGKSRSRSAISATP